MPSENSTLWTNVANGGLGETNRRDFLKTTGTGMGLLLVCSAAGPLVLKTAAQEPGGPPPFPKDFNAYIHVQPNGRITCYVGKVEIGAGEETSLAQACAEELDVALHSIDMVMGDTGVCPWDMGTFGSLTFNLYHKFFRAALAQGRAVLLQMASENLHVPVEKLQVADGVVSVVDTRSKSISYAKLAEGKLVVRHIEASVPTKTPANFKVMGKSVMRLDAIDKVTGNLKYAADHRMPGTLYARVVRAPAFGGKVKSIDTGAAERAGCKVVRDGDLVALIGDKPDLVEKALALVKAEWQREPDRLDDETIYAHLTKYESQMHLVGEKGSLAAGEKVVATALEGKPDLLERTYKTAYAYHAFIETHTNVAYFQDGKLTLWAATQAPFGIKDRVSSALKLDPKNVRVIAPYIGGGFGGKGTNTTANLEAARLAMLIPGKPIQIVWSRAEDIMYDSHRPAALIKIRSGLTKQGKVGYYEYKVFGAGDWGAETLYDFPHQRTSSVGTWESYRKNPPGMHSFNVGPWRGPATVSNTFANEVQMDELAVLAGVDPAEFRLRHLDGNKRMRNVLETALQQFGYKPFPKSPSGRGIGVSCGYLYNTYTCSVAEVEVDKSSGEVKVLRVVNAVDCGFVVNPLGATMQVESCIIFGIGTALSEQVRFGEGKFIDTNFDSYEIPRFSWVPKMEAVLIKDSPVPSPLGLGEPPIASVAPAIANAVYDAVGVRMRQLPMTPERIQAAIKQG